MRYGVEARQMNWANSGHYEREWLVTRERNN